MVNNEDDIDAAIGRVARVIMRESRELKHDRHHITQTCAWMMLWNMVTCAVTNNPTLIQIFIGVVIREKKNMELLHDFCITSS